MGRSTCLPPRFDNPAVATGLVWHYVLTCYGHSISSPSLTLPTNQMPPCSAANVFNETVTKDPTTPQKRHYTT